MRGLVTGLVAGKWLQPREGSDCFSLTLTSVRQVLENRWAKEMGNDSGPESKLEAVASLDGK